MIELKSNNELKDFTGILKSVAPKFSCPKKDKCCKNFKEGKRCKKCPKR